MPRLDPIPSVAVIGAGMSGLFAARTLQDHGLAVTVFEKSRGVGGRMSTRRIEGGTTFDHGAQYFTARDPRFISNVDSWIEQGIVGQWPDPKMGNDQKIVVLEKGTIKSESDSDQRYVAVPRMNSICKHLAHGLNIQTQTRITKVLASADEVGGVELFDEAENSLGQFDRLIISAPTSQTAELLTNFPALAKPIAKIEMNPCWATMVAFEKPITDQWVGAFLHDSILSWAARNSTKPGRNHDVEHLVIHAIPEWTDQHWEHEPTEVAKMMLAEFWKVAGIEPASPVHLQSHRWKYAIAVEPSHDRCFADKASVVVACGDWASGSRVEGAFLSGMAAAERILATLSTSPQ